MQSVREYLARQIRSMNNRFHSEAKLLWSYDYPLANHIATNKSSANREMSLFSRLHPSFGYLWKIFPPRGLKYSLFSLHFLSIAKCPRWKFVIANIRSAKMVVANCSVLANGRFKIFTLWNGPRSAPAQATWTFNLCFVLLDTKFNDWPQIELALLLTYQKHIV